MRRLTIIVAAMVLLLAAPAQAQRALSIDIFGPGQSRVNLSQARPMALGGGLVLPAEASEFAALVTGNLEILPFLRLMPEKEILGGTLMDGVDRAGMDFERFRVSRADLVLTTGWQARPGKPQRVEMRVYEVFTGRLLLGKAYNGVTRQTMARVADMFCASFMETLAGNGDIFKSVLAFSKSGKAKNSRDIWTVTPQGRETARVTFLGGSSMSPSWSMDGRYLAFAHHGDHSHTLGLWDAAKDRTFRVKLPGRTIGGTAFTHDRKVAVAMSRGNMDIFLLTRELIRVEKALVRHWGIDVSPSFDRQGRLMAFVSDRQGTPQVFTKNLADGRERRVTFNGSYNTSPSLSPDGSKVVFSRRTSGGHRIFMLDLETGAERQLTTGPANDEEPTFAPDGYFVAFSSNRSGQYKIYLTTIHGDEPRAIPTGRGQAWHPSFGLRYSP